MNSIYDSSVNAIYYDGTTSQRHAVRVAIEEHGLALYKEDTLFVSWPASSLYLVEEGVPLRLSFDAQDGLTPRLDITDAATAKEVLAAFNVKAKTQKRESILTRKIMLWSGAALAVSILFLVFGMPLLARLFAPLVPVSIEQKLGASIDGQVRQIFASGGSAKTCNNEAGKVAFDKLMGKLEKDAGLRVPLKVVVLNSKIPNAFATSGGYAYILDGLLQKAESPDQLAGVLAHEFGHLYHRHILQNIIEAGGVGLFLGQIFGDFTGSAAILLVTKQLITSAHSRAFESQADSYGIQLMLKAGGDPRALATMLEKIDPSKSTDKSSSVFEWLRSHPVTETRNKDIRKEAGDVPMRPPLLNGEEWLALKSICEKSFEEPKPKDTKV